MWFHSCITFTIQNFSLISKLFFSGHLGARYILPAADDSTPFTAATLYKLLDCAMSVLPFSWNKLGSHALLPSWPLDSGGHFYVPFAMAYPSDSQRWHTSVLKAAQWKRTCLYLVGERSPARKSSTVPVTLLAEKKKWLRSIIFLPQCNCSKGKTWRYWCKTLERLQPDLVEK